MRRIVYFVALWVVTSSFSSRAIECPVDRVIASDPGTQALSCVSRKQEDLLFIVSEKDCPACANLLNRIWQERKMGHPREMVVLWIESDPRRCLEAAQKWGKTFQSYCTSRGEVQNKWRIDSTPRVYWVKNDKLLEQKGLVDKRRPLPWNIP